MFTDAYMLPVDKCIGHKHTKWQPAQLYHFSLSGSAMKALLSRVTRELWACLARKRYTRPSTPPPDLWSTQIGGSVPPFPAAGRRGDPPAHPRLLRPAAALRPQAAAPAIPRCQPPLMWLPSGLPAAPSRRRQQLPRALQPKRPVPSPGAGTGTSPSSPAKARAATPGGDRPAGLGQPPAPGGRAPVRPRGAPPSRRAPLTGFGILRVAGASAAPDTNVHAAPASPLPSAPCGWGGGGGRSRSRPRRQRSPRVRRRPPGGGLSTAGGARPWLTATGHCAPLPPAPAELGSGLAQPPGTPAGFASTSSGRRGHRGPQPPSREGRAGNRCGGGAAPAPGHGAGLPAGPSPHGPDPADTPLPCPAVPCPAVPAVPAPAGAAPGSALPTPVDGAGKASGTGVMSVIIAVFIEVWGWKIWLLNKRQACFV